MFSETVCNGTTTNEGLSNPKERALSLSPDKCIGKYIYSIVCPMRVHMHVVLFGTHTHSHTVYELFLFFLLDNFAEELLALYLAKQII